MADFGKILDPGLRAKVKEFDEYLNRIQTLELAYSPRKFLQFKKHIDELFVEYIIRTTRNNKNIKKSVKKFELETKRVKEAFRQAETKIVTTFQRNIARAFGQAMNSIERDLGEQYSAPGMFGVYALKKILGISTNKKLKEEKEKVEGLTRFRTVNGKRIIFSIQIVPYIILLITVGQAELERQINEALAYEQGVDLVYVSPHPCWLGPKADEVCNRWRDKIVSLTGLTPGFPALDKALAESPPLFHPNCTHSIHVLTPEAEQIAIDRGTKTFSALKKYCSNTF
jgi:hypothetical protein